MNLTSECSQQSHLCCNNILVKVQQSKITKYLRICLSLYFFSFFSIYVYANITPPCTGSYWVVTDETPMVHFSLQVLWESSWGLIQSVQFSTQCNEWGNLQPQLKIITRQSCLWISPAFFITRNILVACYCWQLCWELSNSNKKAPPVQQLIQDLWSVWNFTPRLNVHIIRKQSLNTGKWRRALPLILLNGP